MNNKVLEYNLLIRPRVQLYSFKINLMGLVIQSVGPNHFSKELLKYIYL